MFSIQYQLSNMSMCLRTYQCDRNAHRQSSSAWKNSRRQTTMQSSFFHRATSTLMHCGVTGRWTKWRWSHSWPSWPSRRSRRSYSFWSQWRKVFDQCAIQIAWVCHMSEGSGDVDNGQWAIGAAVSNAALVPSWHQKGRTAISLNGSAHKIKTLTVPPGSNGTVDIASWFTRQSRYQTANPTRSLDPRKSKMQQVSRWF